MPTFSVNTADSIQNQSTSMQKYVLSALHLAFYSFPVFFSSPNTTPLLFLSFFFNCCYLLPTAVHCSDGYTDSYPRKPNVSLPSIASLTVSSRLNLPFTYCHLLFLFSEIAMLLLLRNTFVGETLLTGKTNTLSATTQVAV